MIDKTSLFLIDASKTGRAWFVSRSLEAARAASCLGAPVILVMPGTEQVLPGAWRVVRIVVHFKGGYRWGEVSMRYAEGSEVITDLFHERDGALLLGSGRSAPAPAKMVERDWCDQCADDPAGQRWLCSNRPHPQVPA